MGNIDSSLKLPISNAALSAQHNTVGYHRTWLLAFINYTQVFSPNVRKPPIANAAESAQHNTGFHRTWSPSLISFMTSLSARYRRVGFRRPLHGHTASLWNIYCGEFSSGTQRHQTVTHWKISGKPNLRSPIWQILHLHFSTSLHFTSSLAMGEANSIGGCDSSCGGKDKTGKWHGSAPEMGTSLGRTRVSRLMTSNGGR